MILKSTIILRSLYWLVIGSNSHVYYSCSVATKIKYHQLNLIKKNIYIRRVTFLRKKGKSEKKRKKEWETYV